MDPWRRVYLTCIRIDGVVDILLAKTGSYADGNVAMYPGGDLIEDANGGVVIVEIQYRLGLFGQ